MIICSYCYIREKVKKSEMKYSDMAHSKLFTSGDILTAISKEYKCTSENCYHFQPERSKREDLINLLNDICNNCLNDKYLLDIVHIGNDSSLECLLKDIKMRCSEHCGNTVRDK